MTIHHQGTDCHTFLIQENAKSAPQLVVAKVFCPNVIAIINGELHLELRRSRQPTRGSLARKQLKEHTGEQTPQSLTEFEILPQSSAHCA